MKKYRCIKKLLTLKIVNGEYDLEYGMEVNIGDELEIYDGDDTRAFSLPSKTYKMISRNGFWIELAKKKLKKYFVEV